MERTHSNLSRGLQRLSTGAKLENAAEDAGNLGVAMKIGSKLKQAFKIRENVQNARSFLEAQDSAYSHLGEIITRMSELRTRFDDLAANTSDRKNYNLEFKELREEAFSLSGKKFNGVSIFSTDANDHLSFFLPTSDDGKSTKVAVHRSGFFDNLTIGSANPGSTPTQTVAGQVGSYAGTNLSAANAGSVTPFTVTPAAGSMANVNVNATAAGTTTPFTLTPAAGSMANVNVNAATAGTTTPFTLTPAAGSMTNVNVNATAAGTTTAFQLTPAAGSMTNVNVNAAATGTTPTFQLTPASGSMTALNATATAGGTTTTFQLTPVNGKMLAANVSALAGATVTTAKVEAVRGTGSGNVTGTAGSGTPEQWGTAIPGTGSITKPPARDASGNLYFIKEDDANSQYVIQKVTSAGAASTLANFSWGAVPPGGAGAGARTTAPVISGNNVYVATVGTWPGDGFEYYRVQGFDLNTGAATAFHQSDASDFSTVMGLSEQNGTLFVTGNHAFGAQGHLLAIDAATMALDPAYFGGTGRNNFTTSLFQFGATSNPAVDTGSNTLWTSTLDFTGGTTLTGFNLTTGAAHGTGPFSIAAEQPVSSSPVISGNHVIVATNGGGAFLPGKVHGFNLSGVGNWNYDLGTNPNSGISQQPIGDPAVGSGGTVYVGTTQGSLHAINPATGAAAHTAFDAGMPAFGSNNLTSPGVDTAGNVYFGTAAGTTFKVSSDLTTQSWTHTGSAPSPPLVVNTEAYISAGGEYVKLDDPSASVTLPATATIGSGYLATDNPTVTVTKPDTTTQNLPASAVTVNANGTLTVDLTGVTAAGGGTYSLAASNGAIYLDTAHANTTLNDHGSGYSTGETVAFNSALSTGITYTGAATATVDAGGKIDVNVAGITPTSTGTLTLAFDGPLSRPGNINGAGSGYNLGETPTVTITNGTGDKGTMTATAVAQANGTLNITFAGNPKAKGTLTVQAADGTFFTIPGINDQGSGYNNGDTPAVTVTRGGTAVAGVTGTGTAGADGKVDLTFTGNAGSATPVDVAVASGNFSFATTNYTTQGSGYHVSETGASAPVITVTPPSGAGNAQTVNATVAADGTLSFTLPAPTEAGNHVITAAGGTYFTIPATNDQGSGYANGVTPAVTVTRGGVAVPGVAGSGTAGADGKVDLTFTGNAGSATPVDVAVANGTLAFATSTYTAQGSGYHTSETPQITVTAPSSATQTVNATVAADGTLSFNLPAPTEAGAHTLSAAGGTYFQIPAINDQGSGYANGATPTVTVTRGGTAVAGITGTGTAGADGKVDLTFSGNAGSATPVDVAVANGTMSFATTTYTAQGSGYHTSETPQITITAPSSATQTVNATVAADGTLSFNLPTPNETGNHTLSAAGGTYFQIPAINDQGSGYANGATPTVTVTRSGTAVAGITGNGTAGADGKVDLTFTGNAGSATPVDVAVANGTMSFATTTYTGQGSGYHTSETPQITVTAPSSATQNVNATVAADGTLSFNLPTPTETGNHTLSAAGGTYFQIPAANDQGSGYANGATPAVTVTRGGTPVAGLTANGTAGADGKVDVTITGNAGSATPVDVAVANGPRAFATTTYTSQGSGYHTSETPQITVTAPSSATQNVNATVAADGTLSFNLPTPNEDGAHVISAAGGTYFQVPAANDQGSGYANGATPTVTVTRGGTPVAGLTANGTAGADGRVDVTITGNAGSTAPVDVAVANGTMSFATTAYTAQGSGYHTSETPQITVTAPSSATQNVNATVAADGTLSFNLPNPTETGNHVISAAGGAFFQIAPGADLGSGYNPGDTPAVTLTRGGTPVAGLTANAVAGADGRIDLTYSGDAGSVTGVDVAIASGSLNFAQTTLNNVGSGYSPAEPAPAVTVTDPGGTPLAGATSSINADGTLNLDLSGVTPTTAGNYSVNVAGGAATSIPVGISGVGSGYSPSEAAPAVTVTDPGGTPLGGATSTINANGTVSVDLSGVTPTTVGNYSVAVANGTMSGLQPGLNDASNDLWDYSHADFENYAQTLAEARAVNGATMNSLGHSEAKLEASIQNLELAGGRILDADLADEMVEVAKSQILLRTATDSLMKHKNLSVDVDRTLMGLGTNV